MCQTQPAPGYRTSLERNADTGASCWIDGVTSRAFPIQWVEQSRFGSDSALGVFRQLWCTPEAVTKRIRSHHPQLLGRSANGAT